MGSVYAKRYRRPLAKQRPALKLPPLKTCKFTPNCYNEPTMDRPVERQRFDLEFGRSDHALYPLDAICEFKQVREGIDREAVNDLKASLIIEHDDGSIETDLINEVSVAELDEKHAMLYLEELNLARGTRYGPEGLPRLQRGDNYVYVFLINGHCRRQSFEEIAEERGIPLNRVGVRATVYYNVGYFDAVRRQLNENIHTRPKPYDEAGLVVDIFNLRRISDPRYSAAQCARELGISANRVSDAIAYIGLPEVVKEAVVKGPKQGGISFSLGVELARVQQAYRRRYAKQNAAGLFQPGQDGRTPQEEADYQTVVFLQLVYNRMAGNGSTSTRKVQSFINGHIAGLDELPEEYVQGEFALELAHSPSYTSEAVRLRAMGRAVSRIMAGGLALGVRVDPDLLEGLGLPKTDLALLARAFAEAAGRDVTAGNEEPLF